MKTLQNYISESLSGKTCYCSVKTAIKNIKSLVFQSFVAEELVKNTLINNKWENIVKTNETKKGVSDNLNHVDITGSFEDKNFNIDVKTFNKKDNNIIGSNCEYIATIIEGKVYIIKGQNSTISKDNIINDALYVYDLSKEDAKIYEDKFNKYIKCDNISWEPSESDNKLAINTLNKNINDIMNQLGLDGKLIPVE